MKQIREIKSVGSLGAWVILRPDGTHVATVQARSTQGVTTVNAWNFGPENPESKGHFQAKRATGYGYDRLAEALGGISIDGHRLAGQCEISIPVPQEGFFPRDFLDHGIHRGYRLANFIPESGGYSRCYKEAGLRYLEMIGYTVIEAL